MTTSPGWAKLALALPPSLRPLWFIGRRRHQGKATMDASAQALGEFLNAMRPTKMPGAEEARRQLRALVAAADRPGPSLSRCEDVAIPGPGGDIAARVYAPYTEGPPLPVLVYIHGGGWVIGDLDSYDNICSKLAAWGDCLVISVDYRLAPEHKFPAAPEDCIAAWRWTAEHAGDLGGDPTRLAIGGDSAGGNLTAVVCQAMAAESGPLPALQVLIYPGLDMRGQTASQRNMPDAFILPREQMDWFRNQYLNSEDDKLDVRASPALASELRGQPPAYIVVCGFDPLHDEAIEYAKRLRAAGTPAEVREFPGQIHGFTFMTKLIPEGDQCLKETAEALKRAWRG